MPMTAMTDLLSTYAPERAELRSSHCLRLPQRDPLNPWDIYLHNTERTPAA